MSHPLLHLCSRATTFPGLAEQLAARCALVTDWNALLIEADAQGIAPLVHWHLKNLHGVCPDQFRRGTRLYYGIDSRWEYLQCRWMTHPLHVLWWVRLYGAFLVPEQAAGSSMTFGQRIRRLGTMLRAIVGKF